MKKNVLNFLMLIPKFFEKVKQENDKQNLIAIGKVHSSLYVGKKTFLQIHPKIKELSIDENVSWKSGNAIRMYKNATLILKKMSILVIEFQLIVLKKLLLAKTHG